MELLNFSITLHPIKLDTYVLSNLNGKVIGFARLG